MLVTFENIDEGIMVSSFSILTVIAIVAGIAMAIQAQLMGHLDRSIGTIEAVFLTYGIGAIVIALVMLFMRGGNLGAWQTPPWYAHTAGLYGLVIVGCVAYATPRLGLAVTLTMVVASQFIVAAIVQHFGLLGADQQPMNLSRFGGMATILVGVWLVVK
jgi:transporter family-2 protein